MDSTASDISEEQGASLYMCFRCYQLYGTLEEVLAHQLASHPEDNEDDDTPLTATNQSIVQEGIFQEENIQNWYHCVHCGYLLGSPQELVWHQQQMGCGQQITSQIHVVNELQDQDGHRETPVQESVKHEAILEEVPLIRYQCSDCLVLFETPVQWQKHRKQGECRNIDSTSVQKQVVENFLVKEHSKDTLSEEPCKSEAENQPSQKSFEQENCSQETGAVVSQDLISPIQMVEKKMTTPQLLTNNPTTQTKGDTSVETIDSVVMMEENRRECPDSTATEADTKKISNEMHSSERVGVSLQHEQDKMADAGTEMSLTYAADVASQPQFTQPQKEKIIKEMPTMASDDILRTPVAGGEDSGNNNSVICSLAEDQCHTQTDSEKPQNSIASESDQLEQHDPSDSSAVSQASPSALNDEGTHNAKVVSQGQDRLVPVSSGTNLSFTSSDPASSTEWKSRQLHLCVDCGLGFGTELALAEHRKKSHHTEAPLHICSQCGETFMNTTKFLYHRRTHRPSGTGTITPTSVASLTKEGGTKNSNKESSGKILEGCVSRMKGQHLPETGCSMAVPVQGIAGGLVYLVSNALPNSSVNTPTALNMLNNEKRAMLGQELTSYKRQRRIVSREHEKVDTDSSMAIAYPCRDCGQNFDKKTEMLKHRKEQHGDFVMTDKSSADFGSAALQFNGQEPGKECHFPALQVPRQQTQHHCPQCGKVFRRRYHLRTHMVTHTGERQFSCETCGKSFTCQSNLARHQITHSGKKPYSCEQCGKTFTQSGTLKQHRLIHLLAESRATGTANKAQIEEVFLPHRCSDCGSGFKRKTHLLIHRHIHTGQYPFQCEECGDSFLRKRLLELHQLQHQGKDPVTCLVCGAQFLDDAGLKSHKKCRPGQECVYCGKHCLTQEKLELHQLTHSGLPSHRCPKCGRRFASQQSLDSHIVRHTGGLRCFHCEDCGKDFTTASSLAVHQRIHTGEKPYQCVSCGKRFRQIPHLRDHERLHSGLRPFACQVCEKTFVLSARLNEHLRTHTGEKPYSCAVCNKAFRSLSNLGKHRKTHKIADSSNKDAVSSNTTGNFMEHTVSYKTIEEASSTVNTILLVQAGNSIVPTLPQSSTAATQLLHLPDLAGSGGTSENTAELLKSSAASVAFISGHIELAEQLPIIHDSIEVVIEETV
ncbi:zinc finger protein 574 isoform X2 [Erpetoichthys calabaricus]|nr:zinc finger protein 574 isoform X2 [Erpetoichthys calabaricus]XP_028678837.1 zinc finger protein 574 isoform X2 [Erpetoichthys calabaricus]